MVANASPTGLNVVLSQRPHSQHHPYISVVCLVRHIHDAGVRLPQLSSSPLGKEVSRLVRIAMLTIRTFSVNCDRVSSKH
jgi:hypothetical protein